MHEARKMKNPRRSRGLTEYARRHVPNHIGIGIVIIIMITITRRRS